jgi:hypothetical protein
MMRILQAWSRSRSPLSAKKAEEALRRAINQGLSPSSHHFNKILDIRGKTSSTDTAKVCVLLLCCSCMF